MNWYYVERGQQAGPVGDEQFADLVRNGRILPDTLVWREGMADWLPYRETGASAPASGSVPPVTGSPAVGEQPEAVCAECGNMFPIQDMIRHSSLYICAGCKPVFMQRLAEGAKLNTGKLSTGELNYAGFWIRFAAKVLDWLILSAVLVVPLLVLVFAFVASAGTRVHTAGFLDGDFAPHASANTAELASNALGLLFQCGFIIVQVIYSTLFLGKYGATPGKMVCGLKVVYSDGSKISYGRAFGRSCAEILSRLICCIGYIIAGFDNPQKRALHDHICNTRVVYK